MIKRVSYILTTACVALAFIGAVVFLVMYDGNKFLDGTTITINGETTRTLEAEIKDLHPGSVNEYEITLKSEHPEEFYITLAFREKSNGKLKDYIGVKVETGDKTIEKPLKELLDEEEKVSLGQNVTGIKITYTMSESAGNETQGEDIDFYIDLTAKRVAG